MNHPTREEWMSYLYGELPRQAKAGLDAHLENCPACRSNLADWQNTKRALDAWELPKQSVPLAFLQSTLKWGIAALFVLGFGYGLGRLSAPAANSQALRAGIEASLRASLEDQIRNQVRSELRQELRGTMAAYQQQLTNGLQQTYTDMNDLAERALAAAGEQAQRLLALYDEKRRQEQQTTWTALNSLDTRQKRIAAEYAAFRKEVETLAVLTEDNFQRVWPASYHGDAKPGALGTLLRDNR